MSPGWNLFGLSVPGTSHEKTRLPCQDACAYVALNNDLALAAVSDGAGSASRSQFGSMEAVNQAIFALSQQLTGYSPASESAWELVLQRTFEHVRGKVLLLPEAEGGEARDYACTLTFYAAGRDWLATGQVGDGLAVAQTLDDSLHTIAEPQRGETADSTYFLTDANAEDSFAGRVYRLGSDLGPLRALAAMTDGLTPLAYDRSRGAPHDPFFTPLFQAAAAIFDREHANAGLYDFLASERVNRRTDDDKTLVLAGWVDGF